MDVNRKKVISIVTNCWNEVDNIPLFYQRCKAELEKFPQYSYEFIVEDNLSTDGTREVLREIAAKDKNFKVILNANNFGHIRSPFNCLLNSTGDAQMRSKSSNGAGIRTIRFSGSKGFYEICL